MHDPTDQQPPAHRYMRWWLTYGLGAVAITAAATRAATLESLLINLAAFAALFVAGTTIWVTAELHTPTRQTETRPVHTGIVTTSWDRELEAEAEQKAITAGP